MTTMSGSGGAYQWFRKSTVLALILLLHCRCRSSVVVRALSIRIGTRPSPLALKQARSVAAALQDANPSATTELVLLDSPSEHKGERDEPTQLKPLAMTPTVDFTSVIDSAIVSGRVDMGVHSLKDIPAEHKRSFSEILCIGAYLPRASPLDVLIGAKSLQALPHGARVGSASTRRQSQLLYARPDLQVVNLRGNVETRLKHLRNGLVDALVMASAGLDRLGISPSHDSNKNNMTILSTTDIMPSPGQGIVGAVCRADNSRLVEMLASIDNRESRIAATAERAVLNVVDVGLQRPYSGRPPLAAYMEPLKNSWWLRALLLSPDGHNVLRTERHAVRDCSEEEAKKLGEEAGEELLQHAGNRFLEKWAVQ